MSSGQLGGISRRAFIRCSGLGVAMSSSGLSVMAAGAIVPVSGLNPYVVIEDDGRIVISAPNPDVGQGVNTSLPMIVAEFLDADWADVEVQAAPIDAARYGAQFAGGSLSVRNRWDELRTMGATAREILLRTAAQRWQVPRTELTSEPSVVVHTPSGRRGSYGELAAFAQAQPVPAESDLRFKDPSEFRFLGTRVVNAAAGDIVTGKPIFSIDVTVPDMVFATYVKCPQIGGVPKSANLDQVRAMPGVLDAFILSGDASPPSFDLRNSVHVAGGIAIVGTNTWAALKARRVLQVEWDTRGASTDDSSAIESMAVEAMANESGRDELQRSGDPEKAFAEARKVLSAQYSTAFISHAQLEPQGCVAHVTDSRAEVWTSSQTPGFAQITLSKLLRLPAEAITVHQVRGGGGFGRRLSNEYVREAALIARRVGRPVKLQWTREDDMAFDFFRAPTFYGLQGALNDDGKLTGWRNHVVSVSADSEAANYGAGYRGKDFPDRIIPNVHVSQTLIPSATPTGAWRAPESNVYAFAEQSFLNELSAAAGRDHRDFLLAALGEDRWFEQGDLGRLNTSRARGVINAVTEAAGWGRSLIQGHGLGLGFYFSHAGHVAEVAEVSVSSDKRVTVHRVWVVADLGQIVNLSGAENQFQGSVVDGLSALAGQQIGFRNGAAQESNFDQYPLLRLPQCPEITVRFLESDYPPSGAGEPGLPPLAPAVGNAIFNASGHRVRSLPISREGFTVV